VLFTVALLDSGGNAGENVAVPLGDARIGEPGCRCTERRSTVAPGQVRPRSQWRAMFTQVIAYPRGPLFVLHVVPPAAPADGTPTSVAVDSGVATASTAPRDFRI